MIVNKSTFVSVLRNLTCVDYKMKYTYRMLKKEMSLRLRGLLIFTKKGKKYLISRV